MYNNKFILIITILLIINSIITPVYAIDNSFASVFGGNGKEALAFMTVVTGLGLTFASQSDAVAVYNELKETAPLVIQNMVAITKSTWLGAYNTVSNELISVKNSVYDYLLSKFGTVTSGLNISPSTNIKGSILDGNTTSSFENISTGTYSHYNKYGSIRATLTNYNETQLKITLNIFTSKSLDIYTETFIVNKIALASFSLRIHEQNSAYCIYGGQGVGGISSSSSSKFTPINWTIYEHMIPQSDSSTISVNISSDAGVLDGNFNPDDTEPIMLPPPFFPDINLKERTNSDGSISKYFDGTIDDYMGNVADNNTYSDVETYLQTGTNTTSLTDTGTGTLTVGDFNVDGLPYPEVGTSAPTDVLTGIGGITGLLQGITNWIANLLKTLTNIFVIPTDLALNFDSLRLVDFRNKFPFSIPWDLYNAIKSFANSPSTPNLAIDLDTQYFSVYQPIDLSSISLPIAFARYTSVVFFIIFLISKTRDFIKW